MMEMRSIDRDHIIDDVMVSMVLCVLLNMISLPLPIDLRDTLSLLLNYGNGKRRTFNRHACVQGVGVRLHASVIGAYKVAGYCHRAVRLR